MLPGFLDAPSIQKNFTAAQVHLQSDYPTVRTIVYTVLEKIK